MIMLNHLLMTWQCMAMGGAFNSFGTISENDQRRQAHIESEEM